MIAEEVAVVATALEEEITVAEEDLEIVEEIEEAAAIQRSRGLWRRWLLWWLQ